MNLVAGGTSAASRDAIVEQLKKVLSSQSFEGSERSTKLLRFLVEQTLSGHSRRLKEYTIGIEALGRDSSFDPRMNTIVRAEVSRLRARLDKYYATEGQDDSLVFALPKGSYIPRFLDRIISPTNGVLPQKESRARPKSMRWIALGLSAACVFAFVGL